MPDFVAETAPVAGVDKTILPPEESSIPPAMLMF